MKLFSEYRGLRKELYILFIGRVMTNMGSMIWPIFTLILNQKLGLNAQTIAYCLFVYSIVSFPVSLIGGKLADKMNKKNIIICGDIVSILAYVYCFFVPVTVSSIIIFAIASLFQSIERPAYDALVADFTTSENREKAYSLSYLGGNLGLVLSPTIGGILFNNHLNLAFLISGCSIALSTILIALNVKDIHKEVDTSAMANYEKEIDKDSSAFKYILQNRVILFYICIVALQELVYGMFNYLMPLDLTAIHHENGSIIFGTVTSVNALVVVIGTPLLTKWFRKVIDVNKIMLSSLFIVSGYIVFRFGVNIIFMCYISMIVFTIGEVFNTLAAKPFLTRRIPSTHRGRILSIEMVVCGLFTSIMEIVIGSIYDHLGSASAWTLVIGIGLSIILLIQVLKYLDKKDHPFMYNK